MALPLRPIMEMKAGETVDFVVEVTGHTEGHTRAVDIWFKTSCWIVGELSAGVWTLYGYRLIDSEGLVLGPCVGSRKFQKPPNSASGALALKEICAGLGGIALGAAASGFHASVQLDVNALACDTIRQNGGQAIQADIRDRKAKIALHAVNSDMACILAAGLPYQLFSREGDGERFQDSQTQVSTHVFLTAWFLQPEGLVLECKVEAKQHPEVRALITELACKLGWDQHHVILDLADQWPCRRLRWWCVLMPKTPHRLEAWPKLATRLSVGDVIPEWPCWPQQELDQLRWDDEESKHFMDPKFGNSPRLLDQKEIAPTALHNWGSPLRTCPCGCRGPLSEQFLLSAGLKGFGVLQGGSAALRHPHPQEVGLLNGVSVTFVHNADLRAALCLLGHVASPLQSCWVFAQLRKLRETRLSLPHAQTPQNALLLLKTALIAEREDRWILPSMWQPRTLPDL